MPTDSSLNYSPELTLLQNRLNRLRKEAKAVDRIKFKAATIDYLEADGRTIWFDAAILSVLRRDGERIEYKMYFNVFEPSFTDYIIALNRDVWEGNCLLGPEDERFWPNIYRQGRKHA